MNTLQLIPLIPVTIGLSWIAFTYWKSAKMPPAIGGVYANKDDVDNPFNTIFITVVDVQDGYVRYSINDTTYSSCKVHQFNYIYKKVKTK